MPSIERAARKAVMFRAEKILFGGLKMERYWRNIIFICLETKIGQDIFSLLILKFRYTVEDMVYLIAWLFVYLVSGQSVWQRPHSESCAECFTFVAL
jgi:hypothetical protein